MPFNLPPLRDRVWRRVSRVIGWAGSLRFPWRSRSAAARGPRTACALCRLSGFDNLQFVLNCGLADPC